ncbi:kinesin-like protein KIN-7F isoform X2 [Wolffia australiana]
MSVVSGINASIFAYGQTSSGKTYTMTGLTEMATSDIYDYIQRHKDREFVLKFSAMEIYNESVRDLLSEDNTPLRLLDGPDKSTIVEKLTEEVINGWDHIMQLLSTCEAQREVGETSLNKTSSRSHQIIRLTIESSAREFVDVESSGTLVASVHFVDLAGSERASQAMSAGTRLKEGCHINRSLLTLGTVIRKLSKGNSGHVPYRDSKLTRILQQSLGGNARTTIVCTMSPARSHIEQSRNTLLFATCAKEVATSAQVNVVMSDKALVKHLQRELARLETELRRPRLECSTDELLREREYRIQQMERDIREITWQRDQARTKLEELLNAGPDNPESTHQLIRFQASASDLQGRRDQARIKLEELLNAGGDHPESIHHLIRFQASVLDLQGSDYGDDISRDSSPTLIPSLETPVKECPASHSLERREVLSLERREILSLDGAHNYKIEEQCKEVRCELEVRKGREEWECVGESRGSSSLIKRRPNWRRSFGGIPMTSSSCSSLPGEEVGQSTPPESSFLGESCRSSRPEDIRRQLFSLRFGVDDLESLGVTATSATEPSPSLEETDGVQDAEEKSTSNSGRMIKDAGVNPIMTPSSSPAQLVPRSPEDFERRRMEIIDLWHACNVSILHRTFFFLLCLAGPGDPIYIELELRRLAFLRRALAGGHVTPISPSSIAKAVRRERGMLCRRMRRRLTAAEREALYQQWGIPLETKQRRLQLARQVWTAAGCITHAAESAAVVVKVVGEPSNTDKEMLILSFSLRRGISFS